MSGFYYLPHIIFSFLQYQFSFRNQKQRSQYDDAQDGAGGEQAQFL